MTELSLFELEEGITYESNLKDRLYRRVGDVLFYLGPDDEQWTKCNRSATKFKEIKNDRFIRIIRQH